jgi:hypothetical protein
LVHVTPWLIERNGKYYIVDVGYRKLK